MTTQPDTDPILSAEDEQDRLSERRSFFLSTVLTSDSHADVELNARVRNLSAGGMMIEFAQDVAPELERDLRVVAELNNIGRVKGQIAWVVGRRCGVKFDRPINPELARRAVGTAKNTPDYIKPPVVLARPVKYTNRFKGR